LSEPELVALRRVLEQIAGDASQRHKAIERLIARR
jgi:hypothetical protein